MNAANEAKLAPPGAGLPKVELLVARAMFAWRRRAGSREEFDVRFRLERERIRRLVSSVNAAGAGRRVLIERVRGLEDSSRNWSVWMTLDHLRIVNDSISRVIAALGKGIVPPGQASTARVKPSPDAGAAVVPEYEQTCDSLLAAVSAIPDLKTKARYRHPWFGPLDAAGWHALAAGHLGVHRTQIERIIAGLGAVANEPSP